MDQVFFSDLEFPGQYYGMLIRSSVQHGYLVDIRPPLLPEGYYLYTAKDIPGENRLTALGTSIPVFTAHEIMYFGEPLGIIVGPDPAKVHELVAAVSIGTEPLDPWKFSEKFPASQVVMKRVLYEGDPDSLMTDESEVIETTSEIGLQDHYYAEPLGVAVNLTTEQLEIYTATQWPFHVRATVSAVLDLDPDEITVIPTTIGEAMDGKIWYPSLLAAQASVASVLCKKPVKILFSRQEDFLFSVKSAPVQIRYRTVLSGMDTIEAMTVRILVNAGAYSPLIDEIVDRITVSAVGLYAVPSYRVETYALRTNLPPMGALSGWGEAQAFFALENHIADIIARKNFAPGEWKLLNTINPGEKMTPGGADFTGKHRFDELFETVCLASDFPRKHTAYKLLASRRQNIQDGPLRGIGIVAGFQGNGFLGKTGETTRYAVEVTMDTNSRVQIKTGFHSLQMENILRDMTASILGIDAAQIGFTGTDTSKMTETGPETLSSKITILAPLVEKCCQTIQKQRFRQPLPLTVKREYKPSKKDQWDRHTLKGKPFVSITSGVCAVEVEVDTVTYEPVIRGIWIAVNAGKLYDRKAAQTTVSKSISIALSRILGERITIRDGKLIPKDSVQYDLLHPALIPDLRISFLESDEAPAGIGTIANNLIPAAFASALAQISGIPFRSIPLDARTLYQALEHE